MKLNMTKEAIDAYGEATKRDKDSVNAYLNLGLAYFQEGSKDDALTAFKKVVEISPDSRAAAEAMKYIELLKR